MDIIAGIKEIFGKENIVEEWTADAAHDDFWCPMDDDEKKVERLCKFIAENKEEARKVDNEYVKTFIYMMENRPDDYFAGKEKFNKLFPQTDDNCEHGISRGKACADCQRGHNGAIC